MSKFKVGDRVRIKRDISVGQQGVTESMCQYGGEEVTIANVCKSPNITTYYAVAENTFFWSEDVLEPIVPSFRDIKEKELSCVIHTSTEEQFNSLIDYIEFAKKDNRYVVQPNEWWCHFRAKTCVAIENGLITSHGYASAYREGARIIYEFEDIMQDGGVIKDWEIVKPYINIKPDTKQEFIIAADIARTVVDKMSTMGCRTFMTDKKELENINENIKNKENETMRNTFTFTKGERTAIVVDTIEHKDSKNKTILEKKTRKVKIPTITTTAKTINGTGSTTCDEEDFNERTGCLVASAKIIASKSEEANLIYQIAIKSWGESICTTILETLADRAIAGDFNKRYDKWKKIATEHDKELRTCKMCGKLYESTEEARECEQAHRQRKVDKLNKYRERKETMRMARERLEKERKEQLIKDAMDELASEG